jgi:hypothetical protein
MPIGCLDDSDCPDGAACDLGLNLCVIEDLPGGECLDTGDCPATLGCGQGYCLRCQGPADGCNECMADADCSGNTRCNPALSACLRCLDDTDCSGAQICHPYGDCALACVVDADCASNRMCDEFGRCVSPVVGTDCMLDADCPVGHQCVSQWCKACEPDPGDPTVCLTCLPGQACPSGNPCDEDVFVCVECNDDGDCFGGDLCQLGACWPPCFAELQCPVGATCNLASNRCEVP